jgi:peptidoglycan/LPS O-acetylase OafA/YrhL
MSEPSGGVSACQPRPSKAAAAGDSSNLDALRALAVLLVLADHVLETISHQHPSLSFHPYDWGIGRLGVLLFFVHTSLVLNFSMVRLDSSGWTLMKSFYIRRAFRLYPLSIVCVLAVLAWRIPSMPWLDYIWRGWGNQLANLTLTTNLSLTPTVIGPLWSLPIEAQMYAFLPLFFMLLGPGRSVWRAAALWVLAGVGSFWQPTISDRLNVLGYAPFFVSGVLAFTLVSWVRPRLPPVLWLPFLLGLVASYLVLQAHAGGIYSRPLQWGFCLVVALALPSFRESTWAPLNRSAQLIAKYSYGIYLFHCIALWWACFVLVSWPEPLRWTCAAVVLVMTSVAGYHLIEHPAVRIGARVAAKASRPRQVISAAQAT